MRNWKRKSENISVSQSVQSLSPVRLFATPWITARQASLSITNSQSSLKLMSIESVIPPSHLILCRPLLLPPIPPSIRVFSNESALHKTNANKNITIQKSVVYSKSSSWKLIVIQAYLKKKRTKNSQTTYFLTELDKEEQTKHKVRKRKKLIKIRVKK